MGIRQVVVTCSSRKGALIRPYQYPQVIRHLAKTIGSNLNPRALLRHKQSGLHHTHDARPRGSLLRSLRPAPLLYRIELAEDVVLWFTVDVASASPEILRCSPYCSLYSLLGHHFATFGRGCHRPREDSAASRSPDEDGVSSRFRAQMVEVVSSGRTVLLLLSARMTDFLSAAMDAMRRT